MQNWIVLVAAILNISLGLFVFLPNPKKPAYQTFFLFSLVTGLWCLSSFLFVFWNFDNLFLLRMNYALGALAVPLGILWFETIFGNNKKKVWSYVAVGVGLMWAAISLSTNLIAPALGSLINADKGWLFHLYSFDVEFQIGRLTNLYGIYILAVSAYFMYRVICEMKKATGIRRKQLSYVAFGIGSFGLIVIVTNVILSTAYNVNSMVFADTISSLLFITLAAIAIIRHRFMDIRLVAARSFAYTMLIVSFALIYGSLAILLERLFLGHPVTQDSSVNAIRILLAIIMAVGFAPAKNWLTKVTDKIFYRNQYDPQQLLQLLSTEISETVDLSAILQKTINILSVNLKLKELSIIIINNNKVVTTKSYHDYGMTKLDIQVINNLMQNGPLNYDSLDDDESIKEVLIKFGIRVSVPLKTATNYYGLLLLGDKNSGDIYNSRDMNLLATLCPEIAINTELWLRVNDAMQDLEAANQHLRELDNSKTEFIALISHNLRTPLTLIQGYLSFLLELKNFQNKKLVKGYLGNMDSGVTRLTALVEDVILATSIINNKRQINIKQLQVSLIIDELKTKFDELIKSKNLNINVLLTQDIVVSDQDLLKIIFYNLLENAIKFNHDGGSVTIREEVGDDGYITYSFSDTGIGIPENKQSELFNKFTRETDIYHYKYEGMGLGLYTTYLVVTVLSGKIWFESKENVGSTFYVKLPSDSNKLFLAVTN